jgi:uncharacterized lipoprotein YmbA
MRLALRRNATHPSRHGTAWARAGRAAAVGLAGFAVIAGLGACASTPEPMLIALPSAARDAHAAGAVTTTPPAATLAGVLLVRRPSIPEYMIARRVRYTTDTARLAEWPDAYWAERVEVGMARELVAALREALPAWQVCDASCTDSVPDITLKVDLQRLDVLRGEGRLVARVQTQLSLREHRSPGPAPEVSTGSTALPAAAQTFVQPLPADSAQGQAQAMTELLRSIAGSGAAAVLSARATSPPPAGRTAGTARPMDGATQPGSSEVK